VSLFTVKAVAVLSTQAGYVFKPVICIIKDGMRKKGSVVGFSTWRQYALYLRSSSAKILCVLTGAIDAAYAEHIMRKTSLHVSC
jgi:hypothetical protein